jgi:hypothetical protein
MNYAGSSRSSELNVIDACRMMKRRAQAIGLLVEI